jgi:hypothetical protein
MLFDECFGDRLQAQLLVIAYYQAKNKIKQAQMNKLISTVEHIQPSLIYNGSFKDLMNEVDASFKKAMHSCFFEYNSITEPILSRDEVMRLVTRYKKTLPYHYKLMKEVLGFHLKENRKRNIHLHECSYYDRLLFYQFLQQARIRCCKHMPYWGMVAAGDSYAKGDGEKSIHTSVHSGFSTTISTFLNKTKEWRKNMPLKISQSLSKENKFVCCLDNNQKGYTLKYQRAGESNRFIKVTATCIKKCISISPMYDNITIKPILTYYNQSVPSPLGMPKFETLAVGEQSLLSDVKVVNCLTNIFNNDSGDDN